MHEASWAAKSGHGFSRRGEVANAEARKRLWDECVRLTGAVYE